MRSKFSARDFAGPVVYSSPSFHHLRSPLKSSANFLPNFDLKWLRIIFESTRADKALGAEIKALVVSPSNRSLRKCRHAEHELATARLNLPVLQSQDKLSSGPYVPPTTHDGEARGGKLAPESHISFEDLACIASFFSCASATSTKRDVVKQT